MKNLPSWTWNAAAVLLALVAGILLGRTSSPSSSDTDSADHSDRNIPTRSDRAERNGSTESDRGRTDRNTSSDTLNLQLTAILESSSRLDRTQRLLSFLDRLPTDQFASVYAEISNSPMAQIRGSERSLILQAWAERDPMSAIGYLETTGANDWERETTLSTWASIDPQGAFAWAASSEDTGSVNNWMLGTMRGIAATSPELARDFLTQMEDNKTRSRSLKSIQPYVLQYGAEYTENWIAGISDSDMQNRASRYLANDLANLDPARAGEWSSRIADAETRRDISETVSDRWARQDLDAAKSWVSNLPEDTRTQAAEGVARHYARQDPAEAAKWLTSLGNNPDYDKAREIIVRESYRQDPVTSLGYVSNISDERTRDRAYDRYLRDWMRKDADSALDWATTNQALLPESVSKRIFR
jgi:hypothetical protein